MGTSLTAILDLGGEVDRPVSLRMNAENPPDLGTSFLEFRAASGGA